MKKSVTVTATLPGKPVLMRSFTVKAGKLNKFRQELPEIHGVIWRIVIIPTGTSQSFKVYVDDENGVPIFTKEDCSSAGPYSYAFFQDDTNGNTHKGVAVAGACRVRVADAKNLASISIIIYWTEKLL